MRNIKLLFASSMASVLVVVFVAAITILAELFPPLKTVLKNFSGHHWVSKSILVVLIYSVALAIFYLAPGNISHQTVRRSLVFLIIMSIASAVAIFIFFTIYYFITH